MCKCLCAQTFELRGNSVWLRLLCEPMNQFLLFLLWLFSFLTDSVSIKSICFSRVSFVYTHFSSPTPSMDAHWIWFRYIWSRFVYGFLMSILFLRIFSSSFFSVFDEIDALKFTVFCCCCCTFHKFRFMVIVKIKQQKQNRAHSKTKFGPSKTHFTRHHTNPERHY